MGKVHAHSLGLAFGVFLMLGHAIWSLLVGLGWAQWLLNGIFKLHMIRPPYVVGPFMWDKAIGLVLVTGVLGYIFGWAIGIIWNWCAKKR